MLSNYKLITRKIYSPIGVKIVQNICHMLLQEFHLTKNLVLFSYSINKIVKSITGNKFS